MASPSRGAGGRSSTRSGGRASYGGGGGGGGNNMMPAVIAGVVVVAVVAIAVVVLGGKKNAPPPQEPPPAAAPPVAAPVVPKGPVLGPKPTLPPDIVARAKALMPKVRTASEAGKKLADEALAAKNAGDQDKWQDLLEQARDVLGEAHDGWNEIEDEIIEYLEKHPSQGWDDNMLIDAYLKAESGEVQRLIDEPLSRIKKQSRSK